jgi:hypothetical protein
MSHASLEALASLLEYCESFAKRMLVEAGEFHPFGALLSSSGQVQALAGHLGVELPKGHHLYQFLQGAVGQLAGQQEILAYALAANVNIPPSFNSPFPDGVRVHVEANGYSRMVYTPYRCLPHRGIRKFLAVLPIVEYAEPIAVDVPPISFHAAEG